MKSFIKTKVRKLNDCSGETLIETLAAMLIISFSIILLTTCITNSGALVRTSKNSFSEYYAGNNRIAEQKSNGADATGSVTVKMTGESEKNSRVGKEESKIIVKYYKNDNAKKTSVISYTNGDADINEGE